jgi:hypothetical protein
LQVVKDTSPGGLIDGVEGLDFTAGMGQDNIDEFNRSLEGEEPVSGRAART